MSRTKNERHKRSIGELELRKKLAMKILDTLQTDPEMKDDPRAPNAIEEYTNQLNRIQAELDQHEPQPIVIGLQPASLAGTSPS
jgi:hypothetical protein